MSKWQKIGIALIIGIIVVGTELSFNITMKYNFEKVKKSIMEKVINGIKVANNVRNIVK